MPNKDSTHQGTGLITRRTFIIAAGKVGLIFLLASRMFYMQFLKKDEYKTLSDKNRIKTILIPPTRGQIYDCNNILLAKNHSCFRLFLDKSILSAKKYNEEILLITKLLELDDHQITEIVTRVKKASGRLPAMLIDCITWQQISVIEERKADLKAIFVDTGYVRFYPHGLYTSHLLGYMGRSSIEDQNILLSDENFRVGKNGIEQYYENTLKGHLGHKEIEVNAYGNYVRQLNIQQSIAGDVLYLNIDINIQKEIYEHLNPLGGSVILMDVTNGNVVAIGSTPSADPNQFNQLSNKYWQDLIQDPYKPLINKTINASYPPGSIFKIITILAALEAGIKPNYKHHCTGESALGNNFFRCHNKFGHGNIDMLEAMKGSCNSYMYHIARNIGPEVIMNMAKRFGLGAMTGIDLPGELRGFVPSIAWKKEKFGIKWSLGDTLNLSIGQGFTSITPIQIARLIAAIANNGKLFTPKIRKTDNELNYAQIDLKPEYFKFMQESLYHVMNSPGGTGYYSRIQNKNMQMAGKTGTAQVQAKKNANDDLSRINIARERRNHAMFAGYAPFDNPKYAISVYFDHGGNGGRAAAPIARQVMQFALERLLYK